MGKLQFYWLGTIFLVSLIAWDNWQLRTELSQLQQKRSEQTALTPAPSSSTQPKDCPVITPNVIAKAATSPLTKTETNSDSVQGAEVVAIPPGTSLQDAIKIIQHEQAKSNLGSAAMNPFGSDK